MKVPRWESWPARRTGTPSMSSEPKAASSAKPQSMPPSTAILARRSSRAASLGWTVKPSGTSMCACPMARSVSAEMAVDAGASGAASRSSAGRRPSPPEAGASSWVSAKTRSSCCW